jgi:ribosomal protein S4
MPGTQRLRGAEVGCTWSGVTEREEGTLIMVVCTILKTNGPKHQNANTRLAPGDMVSVNPKFISFLRSKAPSAELSSEELAAEELKNEPSDSVEESSTLGGSSRAQGASSVKDKGLTPFNLPAYASPFIFVPAYLEVSFPTCSVVYVRHPTARPGYSEIPTPYDADGEVVRLVWEWYSKVRPRNRSKRQLAREPENRQ